MALVFQIVLAVVILAGLITVIMSVKNWHWAQMLLLLAIFFSSLGTLVLGMEVFRIHRNLRHSLPRLAAETAKVEAQNEALRLGGDVAMLNEIFAGEPPAFDVEAEKRMPGLAVWTHRLQDFHRQRGRVWTGVAPAGQVDPRTLRMPVRIDAPQPHGLEQDAIVYLFEQGEPSAAAPQEGAQYLGEFRVVEVRPEGATLESVYALDRRTLNRLAVSRLPWAIYETMPADSHELFAGRTEEQLRSWLPEATVEEYIRHGQPVERPAPTDAYDPRIAMYDEQEHRLGPDAADKAVKWVFDRQLRDYAYLFAAANREFVQLVAQKESLTEDVAKLNGALEIAKSVVALRTEEHAGLTQDLGHMQNDRRMIEAHLAAVQRQLGNAQRLSDAAQDENVRMAEELRRRQLEQLDALPQSASADSAL